MASSLYRLSDKAYLIVLLIVSFCSGHGLASSDLVLGMEKKLNRYADGRKAVAYDSESQFAVVLILKWLCAAGQARKA